MVGRMTSAWTPAPDLEDRYTNSDCWTLAWNLHALTGLPIAILVDDLLDDNGQSVDGHTWTRASWFHAGVLSQQDKFVDITGVNDVPYLLDKWYPYAEPNPDWDDDIDLVTVECATWDLVMSVDASKAHQDTSAAGIAHNMVAALGLDKVGCHACLGLMRHQVQEQQDRVQQTPRVRSRIRPAEKKNREGPVHF